MRIDGQLLEHLVKDPVLSFQTGGSIRKNASAGATVTHRESDRRNRRPAPADCSLRTSPSR